MEIEMFHFIDCWYIWVHLFSKILQIWKYLSNIYSFSLLVQKSPFLTRKQDIYLFNIYITEDMVRASVSVCGLKTSFYFLLKSSYIEFVKLENYGKGNKYLIW